MRAFKLLGAAVVAASLVACGGGGGSSPMSSGIQKTYVSSATAGEVLSYSVDTSAGTYNYEILYSAYGLTGQKGSGTLTANSDGTYSPSESPTSKVMPLENGLLIGKVNLSMNGTTKSVPIIGMENPVTTSNELAGTYNYITLQCASKSNGVYSACGTYAGSLKVTAATSTTATFSSCVSSNITDGTTSCTSLRTGTVEYASNGIWKFKDSSSTNNNYMVAFTAPNGQKVGWLDFNDSTIFGYGQGVVSTQSSTFTASDISGDYVYMNTLGTTGSTTITADESSQTATVSSGVTVSANTPWTGFARSSTGTGYGLMAGNGVYVYKDASVASYYYEIGVRK